MGLGRKWDDGWSRRGRRHAKRQTPKEHYPPRLGARCLALPLASLREEFVGWGTVRGLGMKRRDGEDWRHAISLTNSLTVRITQSLLGHLPLS